MHITRLWLSVTLAVALFVTANVAAAVGLGSSGSGAVIGQPLDFVVPLRLNAGETLAPECITAEVTVGESPWPPALVQIALEAPASGIARIRVSTTRPIHEPVISVQVHAGCGAGITRRFVVLADAPAAVRLAVPMQAMVFAEASASDATRTAERSRVSSDFVLAAATATFGAVVESRSLGNVAQRLGVRAAPRSASSERRAGRRVERRAERRTEARSAHAVERPEPRRVRAAMAAPAGARLWLDFTEPVLAGTANPVADALKAVAQAASHSRAAAQAASAAADRMTALERLVEQTGRESAAGREITQQMRARLQQSEAMNRWLVPLLLALLAAAVVAAYLAWRLAAIQRQQAENWRAEDPSATAGARKAIAESEPSRLPTVPIPFVNRSPMPHAAATTRGLTKPAWPPAVQPGFADAVADSTTGLANFDAPRLAHFGLPVSEHVSAPKSAPMSAASSAPMGALIETETQRTEAMPHFARRDETAPRDVSIEELIDLEQQAEFFVVLGQDEAAIELLTEHLSGTGGGSPLPYLKLLEIHRRRGDAADYERLRTGFNHRFNAYAPEWGSDLQAGRTLEDYTGVVPRLQQTWPRPLDSMAELEALLFRRSRGELFELPAYREVLLLYSLARDLLDREATSVGGIDLLLPLSHGADFSSTRPTPYLGLERIATPAAIDIEPPSTATVDFDISVDFGSSSSIFDPLHQTPKL